jgi:hypothetical protein
MQAKWKQGLANGWNKKAWDKCTNVGVEKRLFIKIMKWFEWEKHNNYFNENFSLQRSVHTMNKGMKRIKIDESVFVCFCLPNKSTAVHISREKYDAEKWDYHECGDTFLNVPLHAFHHVTTESCQNVVLIVNAVIVYYNSVCTASI